MQQYIDLVKTILDKGTIKPNRTGVDTISTFFQNMVFDLRDGFPLLTTKKLNWKNILFENLFFLSGDSSPEFLHKHGIRFWDAWIEKKNYEGKEIELLPQAYGEYWRSYPTPLFGIGQGCFDQFNAIIDGLKKDPNNRRLVLTSWHPPSARTAKLPPCHLMSIFNTQWEYSKQDIESFNTTGDLDGMPVLNLHLTQRSMDTAIGCPYNIAGYAFILSLVSHLTNLQSGKFAHSIVDAHLYVNHVEAIKKQITRTPKMLPKLVISNKIRTLEDVDCLIRDGATDEILDAFRIEGYDPHPFIKFDVAV